jgi:hypothetical protein
LCPEDVLPSELDGARRARPRTQGVSIMALGFSIAFDPYQMIILHQLLHEELARLESGWSDSSDLRIEHCHLILRAISDFYQIKGWKCDYVAPTE